MACQVELICTSERVIVKLDLESGAEMDRVVVPDSEPQPHGLSAYDSDLLYCDATSGWVVKVSLEHLEADR